MAACGSWIANFLECHKEKRHYRKLTTVTLLKPTVTFSIIPICEIRSLREF